MREPIRCSGPVTRRGFLQAGSLAVCGLGLADLLRLRAQADSRTAVTDPAVILIWLPGGPPHMETYDMKPQAPAEYRGNFRPIATRVPGLDVCELLPRHARIADRVSIIRSISHGFADHGGGHKRFLTGRDPLQPVGSVNDTPMVGSMVAKVLENRHVGLPNYVAGTDRGREQVDIFSFGSAYLGPSVHPFTVGGDPSSPKFTVQNLTVVEEQMGRFDDRVRLLNGFSKLHRLVDRNGMMDAADKFQQQAVSLLTSDRARNAFDLSREPQPVREAYGMHAYGQRTLLARRLVEAGVNFVTVVLENPASGGYMPRDTTYNWDSHAVNCHLFADARWRFPYYDQAISALVEDLYARGLDRRVLLIATGEFGRTPRISYANGRPGRDHWPSAMSLLVSGGGLRMGQVIGSTNSKGEHPQERPLTPNDLWATMFRHLGIDYLNTAFPDYRGRPMSILPYGEPIRELLG